MELEEPTQIYTKKVLAGDIEDVRARLVDALETVGYDIIEDEPNIIGRRDGQSVSANILDCVTNLTIRLKAISETSTRVTFDYIVKGSVVTQGEKNVVMQEAKTIAAIAKIQSIEKLCPVCETESTDDSKFCRKCGAPLTSEQTELELLRMMGETQAGKFFVVFSSLLTPISALLIILVLLLNSAGLMKAKLFPVLLVFGGLAFLLGQVFNFFGWNRLKRAVETPESKEPRVSRDVPVSVEAGDVLELPPRRAQASVTEGTTNLLDGEWAKKREKEKVSIVDRRNTNDLEESDKQ